jgi:glycosyltransferase involved in cell wall biosynthesis
MKPHIALAITSLDRGGAETQVVSLAIELARRGYKVAVVALIAPSAFTVELRDAGVEVFSLYMRAGVPDPRGVARLLRFLVRFRPNVLHSHLFHANVLARLAGLLVPTPVVISTLHSVSESGRRRSDTRLRDFVYRITDPLASRVVAVCEAVARRHIACRAVNANKVRVIPNCVDCAAFHPDHERRAAMREALGVGSAFVWLAVGRLMWKKGYHTMLRAFATQAGSVLLVAGTGPQADELRDMAVEMGADVRWLGAREDVAALMNAADALVLSSVIEGLPVVLLEAAASGLVAVSTDAGGAREAVVEGETGYVVPVTNVEALAGAMSLVASLEPAERERMSRAAREHAESRFALEAVATEWERCYGELLEGARRREAQPPWT